MTTSCEHPTRYAVSLPPASARGRGQSPSDGQVTSFTADVSRRVLTFTRRVSALSEVRAAVEANHDENRWWPTTLSDPRVRMLAAGWSSRVSYAMVGTYAQVISQVDELGFDRLIAASDSQIRHWIRPIGLPAARVSYLRSLVEFIDRLADDGHQLAAVDPDVLIGKFAREVCQASFKVAQCAVLAERGYHCGVIPVDSGMVTKLAPALGITLPSGPVAHEHLRGLLQHCVADRPEDYRHLTEHHDVTIPGDTTPTWWTHLTLIYFKRLFLNRPGPRLCALRPVCAEVIDCPHSDAPR